MEHDGDFTLSFKMPRAELEKAISAAVQTELATRLEQTIDQIRTTAADKQRIVNKELEGLYSVSLADKEAIERIREAAHQKQTSVGADLDSLFTEVANAKHSVEDQLEKIRERLTRKANWYLIPTATVILLTGILGLWAIVGTTAIQLRSSVATTLDEATKLHGNISNANSGLEKVQQDLLQAQQMVIANQNAVDQLKNANPLAEQIKTINQLKADNKQLNMRVSAAEDWIAKHKSPH